MKLKINIISYHKPCKNWGIVDKTGSRLIQLVTGSKYFHTVLTIDIPNDGVYLITALYDKGVVIDKIANGREYIFNKECVEIDEFYLTPNNKTLKDFYSEIERLKNKGYDFKTVIFNKLFKLNIKDDDNWYCSEITNYFIFLLFYGVELANAINNNLIPKDIKNSIKNYKDLIF